MTRPVNLRQIEAFKAVIESGTVSGGAELLNVSQPAMSQLIAHLEFDSGLRLFDRVKGRLVPTDRGLRLYDEVGRIFAGVRQVQNAVEAIQREDQGTLAVGVMPALASSFVPRALPSFLQSGGNVFCTVQQLSSQRILEWLIARKLDVGLIGAGFDHPYVTLEPLMEHPLVCIMPRDHPLTAKRKIIPSDLHDVAFVTLHPDTNVGRNVSAMCEAHGVRTRTIAVANVAPTLVECVIAGVGVSLVHPLAVSGREQYVAVRRFEPEIMYHFQLGRIADNRNAGLIETFAEELRRTAAQLSNTLWRNN